MSCTSEFCPEEVQFTLHNYFNYFDNQHARCCHWERRRFGVMRPNTPRTIYHYLTGKSKDPLINGYENNYDNFKAYKITYSWQPFMKRVLQRGNKIPSFCKLLLMKL